MSLRLANESAFDEPEAAAVYALARDFRKVPLVYLLSRGFSVEKLQEISNKLNGSIVVSEGFLVFVRPFRFEKDRPVLDRNFELVRRLGVKFLPEFSDGKIRELLDLLSLEIGMPLPKMKVYLENNGISIDYERLRKIKRYLTWLRLSSSYSF